ncbi:phosphatase PAP2 family protein [Mycobacterium sp. 3519A]|uniref:phosphatase PAP2 family protein n=1 Tax=Mycobacterium sp. 3519A TaxID=2057184 RepID=UPI000C7E7164|nr:phosphatase PAP2 family protein [Mycobacterium sp. 3519A]
MKLQTCLAVAIVCAGSVTVAGIAGAENLPNLDVQRGLAAVSSLNTTAAGRAALTSNLAVTGAIQNGTHGQPTLLPFDEQQQLALRDAFITDGNAYELADGLGTSLGEAYQKLTSYTRRPDGKTDYTNVSPAVADLIAFTSATTKADANSGKFLFANATTDGKTSAPAEVAAVLSEAGGVTDVFGKAYDLPAGSVKGDAYGNPRPFQTLPHLLTYSGKDFFGADSESLAWLRGPSQNLIDSPSYPSGHTTHGYTESLLLALLIPERYPQMMARAAEYGNDRIILGAHYAMDVLGGRTLAIYDLAHLLANSTGYVGVQRGDVRIDDFRQALAQARSDVDEALSSACGHTVVACASDDHGRFADPGADEKFVATTQTYDLPAVYTHTADADSDVGKLAPEAGYLLTAAYPYLSLDQADAILTSTLGPGGGFLDNGGAFGIYSRLDLYRAASEAIAQAPGLDAAATVPSA